MFLNNKKLRSIKFSYFLLTILAISLFIQIPGIQNLIFNSMRGPNDDLEYESPQISETDYYSKDWITNGDFSSGATNWTSNIEGDNSDFTLGVSGGSANYVVEGDSGTFNLIQTPLNNDDGKWINIQDPYFPTAALPSAGASQGYGIDSNGMWISHYFDENGGYYTQIASKVWARNCTVPTNLTDYTITSASLTAYINATVYNNIDIEGDSGLSYEENYDFSRFFLLLTDLDRNTIYEAGYYDINDLGAGSSGTDTLSDTELITISDDTLKFYLTDLLSNDHQNFSIALGIRVFCEDNISPHDLDQWEYLLFKNISLSFSYEKKINQLTEASWSQYGDTIPSNYEIDNATLNFRYKIDLDWDTNTDSPNSEFRIILNKNQLGETVKLSTATTSYQFFKVGGLDVANLITPNEEVNVSILVYIADEFTLDTDITISIDDVTLDIDYGIFTAPDTTSYDLLLNDVDRTTEKSTQVTFNENLNITLIYKNSTGDFIPGATVELTGGGLPTTTLSQGTYNNYYTIINSTDLGVGTSYLTLTASKRYYTTQQFQITIEVINRDTELQLFLDTNNRTIEKEWTTDWNEDLNITIKFRDIESVPYTHIKDATVELAGVGATKTLNEDPVNEQYEITIKSFDLGVGSTFLTVYASKENYTDLNIRFKITVTTRSTYLDNLELNATETNSIEVQWNELFDISVSFNDSLTDNFIDGATVELVGPGYSKFLSESGQSYTYTINTFDLSIGNNFLTVLAQKDNYSIASELITITVNERATAIQSILNHTITTAINYPHGELLNITAIYNDKSGPFIDGATVQLLKGSTVVYTLTKSLSHDQYSTTINTNELNLGVNLLTLYAKQDNYSAAFESITITVDERDTSLEIYLEGTLTTAIERAYNEDINITVLYNDFSGAFIDAATVELREGENILYSIPKHLSYNQYTRIINTKNLNLGTNLLAIYANKENYTEALASITITVSERDTILDVFLDETQRTTIEIQYGELLNITTIYKDSTGPFIDGATVELRNGTTLVNSFAKHSTFDQYYLTKDTTELILGSNVFSIYAKQDNYTVALVSISIIVTERDTNLHVYLDEVQTTSITVAYGEFINITAIYEDYIGTFIDGATVELRNGSTTLDVLTKHVTFDQYFITKDSRELSLGSNVLSIYAKKNTYSVSLVSILITINERDTTLDVLLNGIDSSTIEFYNISINEKLNITAIYDDITPVFITGATVELTGTGISETLTQHPSFNQYNYTLNPEVLGVGVHFLVISADKENYTSSSVNFKVNVLERGSNLELYIDGINLTSTRYVAAEIDQILNVTIQFTDSSDDSFITNANLKITGALNENLTESVSPQHYNVSIRTNDLDQGINFLTIFAQKQDYESKSIVFTIEVIEKASNLQLFLNGKNETLGKSIEVTVGDLVNVSVIYEDYSKIFIDNAEVIIVGEGIDLNLTKHPIHDLYNVTIDSNDLNFGINLLTLYAKRSNYQPQTLIVRIEIIEKETDMHIFLNGFNRTIDRTLTLPIRKTLNVSVEYFEFDTGLVISGATIQLVGEGIDVLLSYNPSSQQYSTEINTAQLDIGVRFLTVYAQRSNYQSFTALLRIQVERIKTNITTVSGDTVINRQPGQNYDLAINLLDLDFDTSVLNATVTYTWTYGQGSLTDPDNDGIYEGTITNLREGTFIVTISVYAGDDYEFERFTITLNVVRPPEDVLLFQILTFVGVGAAIGLGGYLFAYQRVLKYPKQVRKIRKYKSKLKKPKSLGIEARSRDRLIDDNYAERIGLLEKQLKTKLTPTEKVNGIKKQPLNDTSEKQENNND